MLKSLQIEMSFSFETETIQVRLHVYDFDHQIFLMSLSVLQGILKPFHKLFPLIKELLHQK